MGKSKGGRNKGGPSRSAAKKGGGRSGGKAASALLKRGRGAKVLRAARGALGVRSGGGSTGNPKLKARYALSKGGAKNNSDIARGYAALEERLVGSNSVEMSRKRKAELRAKIKEAMRRNMCPELRRATSSREQAKLASAPSTDELMALMSQMTHDPSAPRPPVPTPGSPHRAFARGELAFSNNFKPPPPPEVTAGSGSRFSLLADDDDNEAGGAAAARGPPKLTFAPATLNFGLKPTAVAVEESSLDRTLESASGADLLRMLSNLGVNPDDDDL